MLGSTALTSSATVYVLEAHLRVVFSKSSLGWWSSIVDSVGILVSNKVSSWKRGKSVVLYGGEDILLHVDVEESSGVGVHSWSFGR